MEQIRVLESSPEYIEADKETIEDIINNNQVDNDERKKFFYYLNDYTDINLKLEADLETSKRFVSRLSNDKALINLLFKFKEYNEGMLQHSRRIAIYSAALTKLLNLNEKNRFNIYVGAILHDIGKLALPKDLWNKITKPTENDAKLMRGHTVNGYNILKDINKEAALVALQHHERVSGCGYPKQLINKRISYSSRIVSVLDVFDVMSNRRNYSLINYPLNTIYKFFELFSNEGKKTYQGKYEKLEMLINFFGDKQLFDHGITEKFLELSPKA